MTGNYRKGVVAILVSSEGRLLVCQRLRNSRGMPEDWQFPQGGLEAEESLEDALAREVWEETGIRGVEIVARTKDWITYDWPAGFVSRRGESVIGQTHIYFLARVLPGPDALPKSTQSFERFDWVSPEAALARVVGFKRDCYRQAMSELGLISI